jgi:hypothetical protein
MKAQQAKICNSYKNLQQLQKHQAKVAEIECSHLV